MIRRARCKMAQDWDSHHSCLISHVCIYQTRNNNADEDNFITASHIFSYSRAAFVFIIFSRKGDLHVSEHMNSDFRSVLSPS